MYTIIFLILIFLAIKFWPWGLIFTALWIWFHSSMQSKKKKRQRVPSVKKEGEIKYKSPRQFYDISSKADILGGYSQFVAKAKPMIRGIACPSSARGSVPGRESPFNASEVRGELKEYLRSVGYQCSEEKKGTLDDLGSSERLNLIIKTNSDMISGFNQFVSQNDPDILDAFPCLELYSLEKLDEPYDWKKRWVEAGGCLYNDRMIARKDDPVWMKIGTFNRPHPPFAFNSGMWTEEVDRSEAEALGAISSKDDIQPHPAF